MPAPAAVKPRLRGISHLSMFPVAAALGLALVLTADGGAEVVSSIVFATGVAAMFGVSGIYHVITWRPNVRAMLCRLDHATVYGLIAATYTPCALLALDGAWRITLLSIVWTGALLAILLKVFWVRAPKALSASIAIALGWVAVVALPQLAHEIGTGGVLLLAAGGLLYTIGGITYALRRPNPFPGVFGYHEVFHALVIAAVGLQYAAIAFYVV